MTRMKLFGKFGKGAKQLDRLSYLRNCAAAFDPADITPDVARVLEPHTEALRIDGAVQPYAAYLPQGDTYASTTIQLLEEICDSESGECLLEPGWYYGSAGDLIELYESATCKTCPECGYTGKTCPCCGI